MKNLFKILLCTVFIISCNTNDDGNEPKPKSDGNEPKPQTGELITKEVVTSAKDYGKWTYYSIEKGKEVEITDYKNSLDWDIAFHRDNVRLNGGSSGIGKGAAIKMEQTNLEDVAKAPTEGYVEDTNGEIIVRFETNPFRPVFEEQPLNKEMHWLRIDYSNPPPAYTMYENVFVIKTATGKYAKIKFESYFGDRGTPGIIRWKYVLQKDGSTNLK